jgi:hypothetical protein
MIVFKSTLNRKKYKLFFNDGDLSALEPYILLLGEDVHLGLEDEPDMHGALYGGKNYSRERGKSVSTHYYNRLIELLDLGDVEYVSE